MEKLQDRYGKKPGLMPAKGRFWNGAARAVDTFFVILKIAIGGSCGITKRHTGRKNMLTFGKWVKACRVKKSMTLREVAEAAETSYSHLWAIEKGDHIPGLDCAERISRALGKELYEALRDASRG